MKLQHKIVYDFFSCEIKPAEAYAAPLTAWPAECAHEPFAFDKDSAMNVGRAVMSFVTEIIWNPSSAYFLANSPLGQYIPDFLPASCAALRILAIASFSSGAKSPFTGYPRLFPRSQGPMKRTSMPSTFAISST